jgi:stage II sporulation protein P
MQGLVGGAIELEDDKMKIRKIKRIALCVSMLLLSPFAADFAVKGIDAVNSTGKNLFSQEKKLNIYNVSTKEELPEDYGEISEGFGWNEEISDTAYEVIGSEETAVDAGVKPYPTEWIGDAGEVVQLSYGKQRGTSFINLDRAGQVRNVTDVSNALLIEEARKLPEFTIEFNSSEPQVLIMHTHTTESFEPFEREFYSTNFNYRTTDPTKNIVAVGDAITRELEKGGIKTYHDKTIHDYPSYNGSYERSAETVNAILAEYPSIKVVLDIHRDAITDGTKLTQPIADINGKNAAQVMIISCCDNGKGNIPNYMKNFRFASLLQQQMESDWAGLTRPVLFDRRFYNQDITTGSLLIEVGSHGNTIDQVIYSGELIGKSLLHSFINTSANR